MTTSKLPVSLIQLRLGQYFGGFRSQIVVPNVSWGLLNHECDLVICSKSGYLTEVEIKRSYADFLADFNKKHHHDDDERIKAFYYAVPVDIADKVMAHLEKVKAESPGFIMPAVLTYTEEGCISYVSGSGSGKDWSGNYKTRPLNDKEMAHLAHLGCMRLFAITDKFTQMKEKYDRTVKRFKGGDNYVKTLQSEVKLADTAVKVTGNKLFNIQFRLRHEDSLDNDERKRLEELSTELETKKYGQEKYLQATQKALDILTNNNQ